MHEMSIAMNIVDLAVETAKNNKAKTINSIVLELGSLSGVVRDALEFCFDSACKGTMAEGAELEIIELKAQAHCANCKLDFETEQMVANCPECNEYIFDIQGGRELKIRSLNVD
jgi:hydrogenase nickel incorporation protein HypA/HybF